MSVYVDANIFVYTIENHPKYGGSCAKILSDIQEKELKRPVPFLFLLN